MYRTTLYAQKIEGISYIAVKDIDDSVKNSCDICDIGKHTCQGVNKSLCGTGRKDNIAVHWKKLVPGTILSEEMWKDLGLDGIPEEYLTVRKAKEKPTLGVMPEALWIEQRIKDLSRAIADQKAWHVEWEDELRELLIHYDNLRVPEVTEGEITTAEIADNSVTSCKCDYSNIRGSNFTHAIADEVQFSKEHMTCFGRQVPAYLRCRGCPLSPDCIAHSKSEPYPDYVANNYLKTKLCFGNYIKSDDVCYDCNLKTGCINKTDDYEFGV